MKKESEFKTPILIIAWKRPTKTKELINKIKEIKPNNLYIACDGPKNENIDENHKVMETRELLLKGFEEVI